MRHGRRAFRAFACRCDLQVSADSWGDIQKYHKKFTPTDIPKARKYAAQRSAGVIYIVGLDLFVCSQHWPELDFSSNSQLLI